MKNIIKDMVFPLLFFGSTSHCMGTLRNSNGRERRPWAGALGKIQGAYCQNVNPGPAWFAYSYLYRAVIGNTRVLRRREEAECQWKRDFAFQRPAGKVDPCAGWRRRRKSGNAYLLQKDSASLHAFSCQIEKKRCFQQSVFPLSGRFPVACGRSSFLAEKKVFFQPNGKFFLMRAILNRA